MDWIDDHDPYGELDEQYLGRPEQWSILARVARAAGRVGLDTEFYGLDVRKESCVGRARVHVWSLAVRTGSKSPLGFHRARGWVLPAGALNHPELKELLEDRTVCKYVHNQPVDDHAIHNHGVDLRGCINTLGYARWVWPWLVTQGGFGLKNLMILKLRRNPICEYADVVNDVRPIFVSKTKKTVTKRCECGSAKCKKRKATVVKLGNVVSTITHNKITTIGETVVTTEKQEKFQHPLESIVPGHPRWELLVRYAAEDAVAAIEVAELCGRQKDPAPYPYGETAAPRPKFNQHVENEVVLMEREGFPIDVAFSVKQVKQAEEDETKELVWLHKWFVINGAVRHGPHRREEVDDIWSSPKQLLALFDELDFPRSPIWKKGKVKPGDSKLDGTALKWIAKNWPAAKQLVDHLIQLKAVRGGKKYMTKLANSGGWINVICGAAGDADDRNGAVTGRLGIKGALEAQQLPSRDSKALDLYQVRKAIVATDTRQDAQRSVV